METEMKEKEIENKKGGFSSLLKGILIGGLVGAGAVLLAAPRSGEATRGMIKQRSIELKEKAMDRADEARTQAEEVARISAERAAEVKQRGQQVLIEQRANLVGAVEGIKAGVRTYQEQGKTGSSHSADLPAPLPPQALAELPEAELPVVLEPESKPFSKPSPESPDTDTDEII